MILNTFKKFIFQFALGCVITCQPFVTQASNKLSCHLIFSQNDTNSLTELNDEDILSFIHKFTGISIYESIFVVENYFSTEVAAFKIFFSLHKEKFASTIEAIKYFFKANLSKYLNKNWLNKEQENSLELQLKNWGLDLKGKKGYSFLKDLSANNLASTIRRLRLLGLDELPEDIRSLVRNLNFDFRHNTQFTKIDGPIMLSSSRMSNLGLQITTQSKYEFNRNVVKSDDQLYFYVQPNASNKPIENETINSRYGQHSLYLDRDYASQYGWISPYLMELGDLISYRRSLEKNGYKVDNLTDLQVLNLFKLNIYTVSDFTILYQLIIANYIAGNIQQRGYMPSVTRLRRVLSEPEYYSGIDTLNDLNNLLSELGISGGLMELKIPAAIESRYIKSSNN